MGKGIIVASFVVPIVAASDLAVVVTLSTSAFCDRSCFRKNIVFFRLTLLKVLEAAGMHSSGAITPYLR